MKTERSAASSTLDRLKVGSACEAAWEGMTEGERGRFCPACQRDVLDFERMTEAEIRGHIEASGGKLCARLTRRAGALVTAPMPPISPMPPAPAPPRASLLRSAAWRRVSPLAATFFTALWGGAAAPAPALAIASVAEGALGSGSGAPEPESAPRPVPASATGGALRGRILDDRGAGVPGAAMILRSALDDRQRKTVTDGLGEYSFSGLPAGLYDVLGEIPEFEIEPRTGIAVQAGERVSVDLRASFVEEGTTLGILVLQETPLRALFAESRLVAAVRFGATTAIGREGNRTLVSTELAIESLLKGEAGARIAYLHSEYREAGEPVGAELAPGSRALVFLEASDPAAGARPGSLPGYREAQPGYGVRFVPEGERDAYVERLAALGRLERKAENRGELDPADLMEWLVASAEAGPTRLEAVAEIGEALAALEARAEAAGHSVAVAACDLRAAVETFRAAGGKTSAEPSPEVLGAVLTERQRERLTAALLSTETLEPSDLALYRLVRGWHEGEAASWLALRLRTYEPRPAAPGAERDELEWLGDVVSDLEDGALAAQLDAAEGREREIEESWPEDTSEATAALRKRELAALYRETRERIAAALRGEPAPAGPP